MVKRKKVLEESPSNKEMKQTPKQFLKTKDINNEEIREKIKQLLKSDGLLLKSASTEIKSDKELILFALEQNGMSFEFLSKKLQKDKDLISQALKSNGEVLKFCNGRVQNEKAFVLEAIESCPTSIKYVSDQLQDDETVIMKLVQTDSLNLGFASKRLRNDKSIISSAVKNNTSSFKYASKTLKKDKDFIIKLINDYGITLEFVHKSLTHDKELVMIAVKRSGENLKFASESLKKDREIVYESVKVFGDSLLYSDKEFHQDLDLVLTALNSSPITYFKLPDSMKNKKECILEYIKHDNKGLNINCIAKESREDRDIALALVGYFSNYSFYSELLKSDEEIALKSLKSLNNFNSIPKNLIINRDFIIKAVKRNGLIIIYEKFYFSEDKEILLMAIENNPRSYLEIEGPLKKDPDLITQAISLDGNIFQDCSRKIQENEIFAKLAIKKGSNRIPSKFSNHREINLMFRKMFDVEKERLNNFHNLMFKFE